jgi:type I restriction enzyme, S subunit
MNATLEQMAQTLFRAWFVDFEPVKAKAAGLKPVGMDAETAALFPSEFESSTLGLIPKGWSIGTLAQVCEARRETVQPSAVDTEFPYVGLEHIPQKSIALESWGNAAQVDSTKARFKSGDILFGKLRPYFHKVVVAPIDGICSTDILVLKPTESLNLGFVLCHASSIELIEYATRLSNGARMPRVGWKDIGAYPVVVPPPKILGIFTPLVQHMVSRIHNNIQESQTLSQIRDALLPRLISGQLRVPDVVNSVEPVLKRES